MVIPAGLAPLGDVALATALAGGSQTFTLPVAPAARAAGGAGHARTLVFRLVDAGNTAAVLLDDVFFLGGEAARRGNDWWIRL